MVALLLVDKKIASIHDLLPILQKHCHNGTRTPHHRRRSRWRHLSTLVVNRLRGSLKVAAVKAPGFGDKKKAMLQDIACLTGATVISEEMGSNLKEATTDMLGQADKIVITKENTMIVSTKGDKKQSRHASPNRR